MDWANREGVVSIIILMRGMDAWRFDYSARKWRIFVQSIIHSFMHSHIHSIIQSINRLVVLEKLAVHHSDCFRCSLHHHYTNETAIISTTLSDCTPSLCTYVHSSYPSCIWIYSHLVRSSKFSFHCDDEMMEIGGNWKKIQYLKDLENLMFGGTGGQIDPCACFGIYYLFSLLGFAKWQRERKIVLKALDDSVSSNSVW